MKIGRIPYVNCYPVYGAIDRGVVALDAELVDGVPTNLNRRMAAGELDISVVSAVEYARDSERYLLLPDLAISCDGPVRSVMLFSKRPASELTSRNVIVSRSSMTSVALLELLFENVWHSSPRFVPGDAEIRDVISDDSADTDARLVIGDAALVLGYVDPERFLGGAMALDTRAAERVVGQLAERLGIGLKEAGHAVLSVANERMIAAIGELTVNEGDYAGKTFTVGLSHPVPERDP